eukprot:SAG31_NODE_14366_length_811_cov_0.912921_1_plen_212_part_10
MKGVALIVGPLSPSLALARSLARSLARTPARCSRMPISFGPAVVVPEPELEPKPKPKRRGISFGDTVRHDCIQAATPYGSAEDAAGGAPNRNQPKPTETNRKKEPVPAAAEVGASPPDEFGARMRPTASRLSQRKRDRGLGEAEAILPLCCAAFRRANAVSFRGGGGGGARDGKDAGRLGGASCECDARKNLLLQSFHWRNQAHAAAGRGAR